MTESVLKKFTPAVVIGIFGSGIIPGLFIFIQEIEQVNTSVFQSSATYGDVAGLVIVISFLTLSAGIIFGSIYRMVLEVYE